MKFRPSEFHLKCFVSMTFVTLTLRFVQRVICSSLVVHKYIEKGTIFRGENVKEGENVIDTKHDK